MVSSRTSPGPGAHAGSESAVKLAGPGMPSGRAARSSRWLVGMSAMAMHGKTFRHFARAVAGGIFALFPLGLIQVRELMSIDFNYSWRAIGVMNLIKEVKI